MERASKFERTLDRKKLYSIEKEYRRKTCSRFPSVKKETCFYWGKRKYTTCTFILKVFTLLFDQSVRSRNRFCSEALASGQNSSVLSFGETGDRDIFSEFVFGPYFNRHTTTMGMRY